MESLVTRHSCCRKTASAGFMFRAVCRMDRWPTHYEPLESPVHNALYSRDTNPAVHWFTRQENRFAPPWRPAIFSFCSYNLPADRASYRRRYVALFSVISRSCKPELFAEMSPELAVELKIGNGDHISIVSLRGAIEGPRNSSAARIRPLHLNGKNRTPNRDGPFHFRFGWTGEGRDPRMI